MGHFRLSSRNLNSKNLTRQYAYPNYEDNFVKIFGETARVLGEHLVSPRYCESISAVLEDLEVAGNNDE